MRSRHRRSRRDSRGLHVRAAGAPDRRPPMAHCTFYTKRARSSASTCRLSLRRRHAAQARHAGPLRLRQDRRRLRLQVRVLHHPEDARPLSQPPDRVDRPGSAPARRAGRQGAAADLAGHDVLRHRSQGARRAAEAAARAERRRRASSGFGCSTCTRRRSPTRSSTPSPSSTRSCKYIDLPLQHASDAVLKRMKRPGTAQVLRRACSTTSARAFPASRSAPRSSSASPAKPRTTSTSSRRSSTRSGFDHVGVFTYSHEEGTTAYDLDGRRAGGDEEEAAGPADGAPAGLVAARQQARLGERTRLVVDGPSPEHELVVQAGCPARRRTSIRWST